MSDDREQSTESEPVKIEAGYNGPAPITNVIKPTSPPPPAQKGTKDGK